MSSIPVRAESCSEKGFLRERVRMQIRALFLVSLQFPYLSFVRFFGFRIFFLDELPEMCYNETIIILNLN